MLNLHTLESTPIMDEENTEELEGIEKMEESVQKKNIEKSKELVRKLEDQIAETVKLYKVERDERLKIQKNMCKSISENGVLDKQSQTFLALCKFQEENQEGNTVHEEKNLESDDKETNKADNKFIQKNIELAKRGPMANLSLTEDEKLQLENLLISIDEIHCKNVEEDTPIKENEEEKNDNNIEYLTNGYKFTSEESERMHDINIKLQGYSKEREIEDDKEPCNYEDMSTFLLEKALKDIDKKISSLSDKILDINRPLEIVSESKDE